MNVKRLTQAAIVAAALAATGTPVLAQSTNSTTFDNWATDTARQHNGRITRDVYLDEMGRRWDADPNHTGTREAYLRDLRTRWDTMDRGNRGLTPAEVSGMRPPQTAGWSEDRLAAIVTRDAMIGVARL